MKEVPRVNQNVGILGAKDAFTNELLRHRDGHLVGKAQIRQIVQEAPKINKRQRDTAGLSSPLTVSLSLHLENI